MRIEISGLTKRFGEIAVFEDLSLGVEGPGITTIIGPSGCGKTTLLNIVAKVEQADSGDVRFEPPGKTVGYVMQEPLLLPWRTLAENARLGAELVGSEQTSGSVLARWFQAYELGGCQGVYPDAASGGMKQRVALIRTLLTGPGILLLDEPFAALDFDIKLQVQHHLLRHCAETHATALLVTHDIEDAIALSDKIVVLSEKPAKVKASLRPELGSQKNHPAAARKSPGFAEWFTRIWDELKYLDDQDGER